MAIFNDITLTWQDIDYTISGTNVLPLIAQIEDSVITVFELFESQRDPSKIKLTKVAKAYAMALRYAGAPDVDDAAVYQNAVYGNAVKALTALLSVMVPPFQGSNTPQASKKKGDASGSSEPAT